jgi:glucose 1-dehydrogenase
MRALVTGVSEGIGGAICRQIARQPRSEIAMCVRRNRDSVEQFADELRRQDCSVLILEGDLRDPATPEHFVETAAKEFGGLDAIVSNAGAVEPSPLEDMSLEVWDDMYALSCRATWLLAKAGFPHLKASRGAIVAISSQSGVHPHRQTGAYSSAKAALIMLCKQMALEWGQHGIRVNAISPGMIKTPMTEAIYEDIEIARQREAIVPLQRIGAPYDVARTVAFLIDPDNHYITGQNVIVDGGLTLSVLDRIPGIARRKERPQ